MKKIVLLAFIAVLLFSALVGIQVVNLVAAQPPFSYIDLPRIYVRSDGSVEPATAPIHRVGDVYTFMNNIVNYTIEVQRDHIMIDGAGYTLQPASTLEKVARTGIDLSGRSNVTIKNIEVKEYHEGIRLFNASSNNIVGNTVTNTDYCVGLLYSSNNRIEGNNMAENHAAIILAASNHNSIVKNNITKNSKGITAELNPGSSSYDSIIGNNITENSWCGIHLSGGFNYHIEGNNITKNECGIIDGDNCNITGNNIRNNKHGISLASWASYNSIVENTIANNDYGIRLGSSDNSIYHNDLINNTNQVIIVQSIYIEKPTSTWDNGKEGNYWSNYNGTDNNGDGVGDIPYVIDENNQDNYPLMKPVNISAIVIPEFPDTTPHTSEPFPTWIIAAIAIIAVVGAALLVYFRKIKKTKPKNNNRVSHTQGVDG